MAKVKHVYVIKTVKQLREAFEAHNARVAAWDRNRELVMRNHLARKPQNFDNSSLPLFGDLHKQKELF